MTVDSSNTIIPFCVPEPLGVILDTGIISPTKLKVAETNNRTIPIPDRAREEIYASIRKNGVEEAVYLNENYEIVSGQIRWLGALTANLADIPYIRMKFKDAFSERVFSMTQDCQHNTLMELDKFYFVQKCVEVDKKTLLEISVATGKHIETIRAWSRTQVSPAVLSSDEQAKQSRLNLPLKKRKAIDSMLSKPQFKNNIPRALDAIAFAGEASTRDIEQARKDTNSGLSIDFNARMERMKERQSLLEIKIPKSLDIAFRDKLKKTGEDYVIVIEELIRQYVRS
jgi:hypothetical protein